MVNLLRDRFSTSESRVYEQHEPSFVKSADDTREDMRLPAEFVVNATRPEGVVAIFSPRNASDWSARTRSDLIGPQ